MDGGWLPAPTSRISQPLVAPAAVGSDSSGLWSIWTHVYIPTYKHSHIHIVQNNKNISLKFFLLGAMAHTCNPSALEMEEEWPGVQGNFCLHKKFQTSLTYTNPESNTQVFKQTHTQTNIPTSK